MIIPTTGSIVPWLPGHLRSPYSPNDFVCKCDGCGYRGIYGESNVCTWTIDVSDDGKIELKKTKFEWIYCSGCTMPMQIRPARDLSEPNFYVFDTIDELFDQLYTLIDIEKLSNYWNIYYEYGHNTRDFDDHLRGWLRGQINSKNMRKNRSFFSGQI